MILVRFTIETANTITPISFMSQSFLKKDFSFAENIMVAACSILNNWQRNFYQDVANVRKKVNELQTGNK